jgi:hypothetical protein
LGFLWTNVCQVLFAAAGVTGGFPPGTRSHPGDHVAVEVVPKWECIAGVSENVMRINEGVDRARFLTRVEPCLHESQAW